MKQQLIAFGLLITSLLLILSCSKSADEALSLTELKAKNLPLYNRLMEARRVKFNETLDMNNHNLAHASLDSSYLKQGNYFYAQDDQNTLYPIFYVDRDYTFSFTIPLNIAAFRTMPDAGLTTIYNQAISTSNYGDQLGFNLIVGGLPMIQSTSIADGAGGTYDNYIEIPSIIVKDEILQMDSISKNGKLPSSIPAKYLLEYVVVENLAAKDITLCMGTKKGLPDVFNDERIAAKQVKAIPVLKIFSLSAPKELFVFTSQTSDWKNIFLNIRLVTKRISK